MFQVARQIRLVPNHTTRANVGFPSECFDFGSSCCVLLLPVWETRLRDCPALNFHFHTPLLTSNAKDNHAMLLTSPLLFSTLCILSMTDTLASPARGRLLIGPRLLPSDSPNNPKGLSQASLRCFSPFLCASILAAARLASITQAAIYKTIGVFDHPARGK